MYNSRNLFETASSIVNPRLKVDFSVAVQLLPLRAYARRNYATVEIPGPAFANRRTKIIDCLFTSRDFLRKRSSQMSASCFILML